MKRTLLLGLCSLLLASLPACDRSSDEVLPLKINEAMPRNQQFPFADLNGLHLDWVEIYNPNDEAVYLGGYSLTDNPDRPEKFRFPEALSIPARGYLVVWLAGADAVETARAEGVDVVLTPLHAQFGISPQRDEVLIHARGGDRLVDRIQINNVRTDASIGRYPDGGPGYGQIYAPTPGSANNPAGLEPVKWKQIPQSRQPLESGEVPVTFSIEQDATEMPDPVSPPAVFVGILLLDGDCDTVAADEEFAALDVAITEQSEDTVDQECASVPGEGGILVPDPDDGCRRDARGEILTEIKIRRIAYEAVLPPLECGTKVQVRVIVADSMKRLPWTYCYTYCEERIPVVVSEYQPRNQTTLFFICETCTDPETVRTPDWLEIFNYGGEPVDLTGFALTGRRDFDAGDVNLFTWTFGDDTQIDGKPDPYTTIIGPGEYRLILADQDGGDVRRIYRKLVAGGDGNLVPDMSRAYFSTRFALNPSRASGPDEFLLVSNSGNILEQVVLDFTEYAAGMGLDLNDPNFLADLSAGRFPEIDAPDATTDEERYPAHILQPGTVTECPTPELPNTLDCLLDVTPIFSPVVTVFPRSPAAGEEALVRARLSVDSDTLDAFFVEVRYRVDGAAAPPIVLEPGQGVELAPAAEQSQAARGALLYDVEARIPGQPPGSLVVFSLFARDEVLGLESEYGEESPLPPVPGQPADPGVSFRYLSGYERPAMGVRINEILPNVGVTPIPGMPAGYRSDYAELYLPADAPEDLDLSGCYLTDEKQAESEASPIRFPRRWRFPDGTILERGGFLLLVFAAPTVELPPGTLYVDGLALDACAETLYLIGPEELGNCVVDRITWSFPCQPTDVDFAYGWLRDGDAGAQRLTAPTPGVPNALPPILHGVGHVSSAGVPNVCVAPGSTILIQVTVMLDRLLIQAGDGRDAIAGALRTARLDFEGGGSVDLLSSDPLVTRSVQELPATYEDALPEFVRWSCAGRTEPQKPCYEVAVRFRYTLLTVPDEAVVRYSLRVEDACGGLLEPCEGGYCFSFGTSFAPESVVRINEINRYSLLPGGGDARRPWLEIYNPTSTPIPLAGHFLSCDPSRPRMAPLPEEGSTVPAGGFLLVVTDGGPRLEEAAAPAHVVVDLPWAQFDEQIGGATRRRCRDEGEILLTSPPEEGSCLLARMVFDFPGTSTECNSLSAARMPDGADAIEYLDEGTPGAANVPQAVLFVRGDANVDCHDRISLDDPIFVLSHLYLGGGDLPCEDAADADDDGSIEISDAVYLLSYLFLAGPLPLSPFPQPGADPTADALGCESYPCAVRR
ncbi:MAG: lamin tail domain-containing protein [Planctomycetes bacterium]|nr:lamin tail domain-containing protein [Planctomycetota bacterium]